MRVLVVGNGGREHSLCWVLNASPLVDALHCAPGSDAIASLATCEAVDALDIDGLTALAKARKIDLVVVGPEAPLALGLVDRLQAIGIKAFGPSQAAAQLESSKSFMKAFAARHAIPTAAYQTFDADAVDSARSYLRDHTLPVVIKADGLAAGKGVTIATTLEEALEALDATFDGAFGAAGHRVVIEEFMDGEEASLFAICDGKTALEIGTAQDHKRAFDGDLGPNTGGMGAYSPAPILTPALIEDVMARIVQPTIAGMAVEGMPFTGFLYVGLMIDARGPRLVEFNARFGDPECQVVMPRLQTDLAQLIEGACDGQLAHMNLRWLPLHAISVVMAAKGYPGAYEKGTLIKGLEGLDDPNLLLYHAGTKRVDGDWQAQGGRVLNVTGIGETLSAARDKAYGAIGQIDWPDGYYRSDIGWRALLA